MAVGAVGIALPFAGSAEAGGAAFDRFVEVCLEPLSDFQPAAVAGLAAIETPDWAGAEGAAFAGPRRHVFVVGDGGGLPSCRIVAAAQAGTDLAARFEMWSARQLAQGTWEERDGRLESLTHEPRIAIEFFPASAARGPMIEVRETDKEA
ncbi:hypothetical protein [uncultured Roseobacter sp.]|uniref:hypothetical protein n=1 Tax=uncultured Roseobacter sp. TaxID=114847 RepID=UPI002609C8E9|nr:hypothetical protein [uncultured Roseobacter sp.]